MGVKQFGQMRASTSFSREIPCCSSTRPWRYHIFRRETSRSHLTEEVEFCIFHLYLILQELDQESYVASRVCNVDCQYLSKLCPPSPPRRVMCIDDGRRLSSLRKGWYLLLGDLVPCVVFISSSIDQLRLDWTRSVLSGPRFSLPVTALPSSCSGAKAVRACH